MHVIQHAPLWPFCHVGDSTKMSGRPKRPRLASSRLLQSIAARSSVTDDQDSEDNFVTSIPRRGRGGPSLSISSMISRNQNVSLAPPPAMSLSSASDRLNVAVRRGLRVVRSDASRPTELSNRFPFLDRTPSNKQKKSRGARSTWKTVPFCLRGPVSSHVPLKSELDLLCREGLGTLWFSRAEDPLELEQISAEELHFVVLCLYPMLKEIPYQFCRAAGVGNKVIVPLHVDDSGYVPDVGRPFQPYFTVLKLKEAVGRKGRVYIRPMTVLERGIRVSETQVYTPVIRQDCYRCKESIIIRELPDHMYVCPGERDDNIETNALNEEVSAFELRSSPLSGRLIHDDVSTLSAHPNSSPPSNSGSDPNVLSDPETGYNAQESEEEHRDDSLDSVIVDREIREEQDRAYERSLRADREKDRQRLISRQMNEDDEMERRIAEVELVERQRRLVEWHRRIRSDLHSRVPDEPPLGTPGMLYTRIRFPDGSRASRGFLFSDPIDVIYSFIGSHESINPRGFRVLVSDSPAPTELSRADGPISLLRLSAFTVLIGENVVTRDEEDSPPMTFSDDETLMPSLRAAGESAQTVNVNDAIEVSEVQGLTTDDNSASLISLSDLDHHRSSLRSGLLSNGVHFINVDRNNIVNSVIDVYSNMPTLHEKEVKVRFARERGLDGGGLRRELCNCFWSEYSAKMDGVLDHVPQVLPSNTETFYQIGRFISHWYLISGYFPICLSIVSIKVIICGQNAISDDELCKSFSRFIDKFEAQALEVPNKERLMTIITPMLSRFNVFTIPTLENLPTLVKQAAMHALVTKPFYALCEIRRGMLNAHPSIWKMFACKPQLVDSLYDALEPTVSRVLAMIEEPASHTARQDATFDFLRRFVNSLNPIMLGNFLSFVTGFSVCSSKKISIQFNSLEGAQRRPTANTCSAILHLPLTYDSYMSFSDEFLAHLGNSAAWRFDFL